MNGTLIGQHLLRAGKISDDDIERASHLQESVGGRFGSALIKLGAISEDHLLEGLSEQLDLPILDESEIPASADLFTFMSNCQESFDWFLAQEIAVWEEGEGELHCIARDVLDPALGEALRLFHPNKAIKFGLTTTYLLERILSDLSREHAVDNLFQQNDHDHLIVISLF